MLAPTATDAAGPMIQYDSVVVKNESTSSAAGNGNAVQATSVTRGSRRSATNHVTAASSAAYMTKRTVETSTAAPPRGRSAGAYGR